MYKVEIMWSEAIYFDFEFPQLMVHVIEWLFVGFFFCFLFLYFSVGLRPQKRLNVRCACIWNIVQITKTKSVWWMHCNRFNNSHSYYIQTFTPVNRQLISYGGMIPVRYITALGFRISVNWNVSSPCFKQNGLFIVYLTSFAAACCFGCLFAFICLSLESVMW